MAATIRTGTTVVVFMFALVIMIYTSNNNAVVVEACTDILVTPGASSDGSAMIAYNADSVTLYGVLYHYPAKSTTDEKFAKEEERMIFDWDTGKYLGNITEVATTYNVVGNGNEHGLVIGESTFGGVEVLAWNQTGAIMDYGSLIYITLQRAKTVREAIHVMVDLMDTYGMWNKQQQQQQNSTLKFVLARSYLFVVFNPLSSFSLWTTGYASGGESFSLADKSGEVWMMEVISRGSDYHGKLGAVWVAQKIPDGYVAAHANQARITTFPRDDPENFLFSDDVVDVAIHYGLYSNHADPAQFSFSDVYQPVDFLGARTGDARVWSVFSQIADPDGEFQKTYQPYALGEELSHRMPLYIKPYRKLSLENTITLMNSHFEGTVMDSSVDVGAGLFESPYRPRPLVWNYRNTTYHNERSIATPRTGWNFIAQLRTQMPRELSVLIWFAADDSSTSPRAPVYASSKRLSKAYYGKGSQDGVKSPLLKLDLTKAFWIQNMVSNFAYYRWNDVYPVLRRKIDSLQDELLQQVVRIDEKAIEVYKTKGPDSAVDYVTQFTVKAGNNVQRIWTDFYGELFVRFRDFYNIVADDNDPLCGCVGTEAGLSDAMKRRIVSETGDHYKVLEDQNRIPILRGENLIAAGEPFDRVAEE